MSNTRLLSASQLAVLFDVDAKTVHKWFDTGKLRGKRTLGGHRRCTAAAVKDACESLGVDVPAEITAYIQGDLTAMPSARALLRRASVKELIGELARRGVAVSTTPAAAS